MAVSADYPGVGVVGTGYWGRNLVRVFHQLGHLRLLWDSDGDSLATVSADYPQVAMAGSWEEFLAHPGLDAVVVATPAVTHGALVRQALLAGKDVFVEKPLCLSENEGVELVALAQRQQRILMVGHLLWYHPAVLRLAEMVRAGELGRLQYIYSNRLNLGKLRREENVLWSFAPHDISIILGMLDQMPTTIFSQGSHCLHTRVADTTLTSLGFANGLQAHLFVSWLHPFKEQRLVLVGERQMAVFDDTAPWAEKLRLYPHAIRWTGTLPVATKAESIPVQVAQAEPLREECLHFLDCVRHRTPPRTDGAEGVRVLAVLNRCQDSMKEGRILTMPEGQAKPYYVHESAMVDGGVEIGEGCKVWHFSHILAGSRIGARCNIGQNVVIGPNAMVGAGCKIQNNVSVVEGVTLEDDVFCGPSMVFTNVFNPRAHVSRRHVYRPTLVRQGATIGANATVVCGITLGRHSFIGAGAVVTRDVPDHALMAGNPARPMGWMCQCGEKLDDTLLCLVCGKGYTRVAEGLREIPAGAI